MANMTDPELDKLLGLATTPEPPEGAARRAVERALAASDGGQVVVFALRPRSGVVAWLAALPLAASLAAGVYLGAMGGGGYVLPYSLGGAGLSEEAAVVSGIDDMETLNDEDVS